MEPRALFRLLDPLLRRVRHMVRKSVVNLVDPSGGRTLVQVHRHGGRDGDNNIEYFESYGFSSVPFPGAEGVDVAVEGNPSNTITICIADRRYKLKTLVQGEVAIYDDQGQSVSLKRDGIYVTSPTKIRFQAPVIEVHATTDFRFDVNGHGQHWFADRIDTYQEGEVAGTSNPISPPEIA